MSVVIDLGPSVALGDVARNQGLTGPLLVRVLRAIVRAGLARPVATFLLEEEQRISNERVRRAAR